MTNTVKKPIPAMMMDRGSNYMRKQARMEAEEAEIKRLEAEARGEAPVEAVTEVEGEVETPVVAEPALVVETEASDDNLSSEEKSFKKRYGDLRRHMAEKEKEWADKASTPAAVRAPKSDEDLEAWAAKNPDIASIVETIAAKKADDRFALADARLSALDEREANLTRATAMGTIKKAHSDFDSLNESDAFHDWVETQPQVIQDALYVNSEDPQSVIRVLDMYKLDNGLTPSARKKQTKDAASAVKTRTKVVVDAEELSGSYSESQVKAMSAKEFEEDYEAIMEAQRNGKFIYDITGSAR